MYLESKRIFISDLPEELTSGDVTKRFSQYGIVSSVEIKERKDLGPRNSSRFFAFVNLDIDSGSLQKCFQEISNKRWNGQYVQLQLAREHFLDRLKKEREEAKQSQQPDDTLNLSAPSPITNNCINSKKQIISIKKETTEVSTDSSDSEDEKESITHVKVVKQEVKNEHLNGFEKLSQDFQDPDIVYKSCNKSRIVNKKLVIESVGNKPIFTSTIAKSKSLDPKRTEADQRRIQSMFEKTRGFNRQKLVIKSALSKIDATANINENIHKPAENLSKAPIKSSKKPKLFENDEVDDETYNFSVKKQYEGVHGQKLLALQSNYKNDARFKLDERFVDQEENLDEEQNEEAEDDLIGEKRKEYEIMEVVLGTKVTPNMERPTNKLMLRFDPNEPEHSKYEIKGGDVDAKPAKKQKREKVEVILPEVSKETFFDVDDNLKDALQEKSSFSLLGMFGQPSSQTFADKNEDDDNTEGDSQKIHKKNSLLHTQNPFKYDSSDDEQTETAENIKHKKPIKKEKANSATVSLGAKKLWTESLFFKDDDYRFQDGMEFVIKLGTEETGGGISEVRQEIKQIVRAKVRNNKGKNKMFKKKLGGQKKFKFTKGHKKH